MIEILPISELQHSLADWAPLSVVVTKSSLDLIGCRATAIVILKNVSKFKVRTVVLLEQAEGSNDLRLFTVLQPGFYLVSHPWSLTRHLQCL